MVPMLLAVGCSAEWSFEDMDGDGITIAQGDCWDDPIGPEGSTLGGDQIRPGGTDKYYDGVDADCADNDDYDQDGDGYVPAEFAGMVTIGVEGSGKLPGGDCWDDPADHSPEHTVVYYLSTNGGEDFIWDQPIAFDVNPGATEVWYDGLDGNCDFQDDFDQDGDSFRSQFYPDQDGAFGNDCIDGSPLDEYNPAGLAEANINPGAVEIWYDGTDSDCDYNDCDADYDGFDGPSNPDAPTSFCVSEECDDSDDQVMPDGTDEDVWYDGKDSNCDGNDGDQDGDGYWIEDYAERVAAAGGAPLTVPAGFSGDCWDDLDVLPTDMVALNSFRQPGQDEVYPGASDRWYDGIDANCDDHSDFDQDDDGYDTEFYGQRDGSYGDDCIDGSTRDDANPAGLDAEDVHPSARDTWYDGTDANCDNASDYDQDADGHDSDDYGGGDCNDSLTTVNPGLPERCSTGFDDDCDGDTNDIGAEGCIAYYYDADEDDYGTTASQCMCRGEDAYTALVGTDCNDGDDAINPSATEICDAADVDEDCDGTADDDDASADDGTKTRYYPDDDEDGYGDLNDSGTLFCDDPSDSSATWLTDNSDCDDDESPAAPYTYPGAAFNDDSVDCMKDNDGDGFGDDSPTVSSVTAGSDCNDAADAVRPTATEYCDDIDNDCDDVIDEDDSADALTWYEDADGDGYGDLDSTHEACELPSGYTTDTSDCDDTRALVNPGMNENCLTALIDDNCDGELNLLDADHCTVYYYDADGDAWAPDLDDNACYCEPSGNYTTTEDGDVDCDDADEEEFPGSVEYCDGDDDDCDGESDEDDAADCTVYYSDSDGDAWAPDLLDYICACATRGDYTTTEDSDEDCDDADEAEYPGSTEYCDGDDDDCDGFVDEQNAADCTRYYLDVDDDGWSPNTATYRCYCAATGNYTTTETSDQDCDDSDPDQYPGATETCSGEDDDCDGTVDEEDASGCTDYWFDGDGDGWTDDTRVSVSRCYCEPTGYYTTEETSDEDCDDSDGSQNPAADEYCNSEDDDCDGDIDEANAVDCTTFYYDFDGDDWGVSTATSRCTCFAEGYWRGTQSSDTDCDDTEDTIYPGAQEEVADGIDQDCDDVDSCYEDADGDGYGTDALTVVDDTNLDCADGSGGESDVATDCDDGAAGVNPGEVEVCDAADVDEDCNGLADDADPSPTDTTTYYVDDDDDGYGDDTDAGTEFCDPATGYVTDNSDCDDTESTYNPAGTEVCDALDDDEDCDGLTDDADPSVTGLVTYYLDDDSDGYGDETDTGADYCDPPSGVVADNTDCDDSTDAISPADTEVCDALDVDEDCDGLSDDDDSSVTGTTTYYPDGDSDGYGDETDGGTEYCDPPSGVVTDNTDCDDGVDTISPAGTEVCDALDTDEDCDGLADDADTAATGKTTWYLDVDGDGYGDETDLGTDYCDEPTGVVTDNTDCDDSEITYNPAGTEVCDALDADEDCDGLTDDADPSVTGLVTYYVDVDSDGYGDEADTGADYCDPPSGVVADNTDCDDSTGAISPADLEVCDALDVDEDCDGLADDADSSVTGTTAYYPDGDSDGYGDETDPGTDYCDPPSGVVTDNTDCDDGVDTINPAGTEVCDALDTDEDCDGLADDADTAATGKTTWYLDVDSDGYGDETDPGTDYCDAPTGVVTDSTDCDDSEITYNPAGTEVCDALDADEDCDGLADDADSSVTGQTTWYVDADSDGYGDETDTGADYCDPPSGVVTDNTDCDDGTDTVSPADTEVCDALDTDEDCDGFADDADTVGGPTGTTTFYADTDSDGLGDSSSSASYCDAPSGYVADSSDCDDTCYSCRTGTVSTTDDLSTGTVGVDDDCDGYIDEDEDWSGALVVNELMPTPQSGGAEWIEIVNTSTETMYLDGWQITGGGESVCFSVDAAISLAAGDVLLLCEADDVSGATCDYVYGANGFVDFDGTCAAANGSLALGSADTVSITDPGSTTMDSVAYTGSWPYVQGSSMELSVSAQDASSNDSSTNWCEADSGDTFTSGSTTHYGTPGAANTCL